MSNDLTKHSKIHTGEKLYVCQYTGCGLELRDVHALKRHVRTHTGEKPYLCTETGCSVRFSSVSDLVRHKKIHTGERSFACQEDGCRARFAHSFDLKKHNRIHTGDKPYVCEMPDCGSRFSLQSNYSRHMKNSHSHLYAAKRKTHEERICEALKRNGWSEWYHPELMPAPLHFKREKRIDFSCVDASDTWCRIDFVICPPGGSGYVFLEVDENQHMFGYDARLSCDMKRMSKVMTSLTLETSEEALFLAPPPIFWLRFNPSSWHVDGVTQRVSRLYREGWLCGFLSLVKLKLPLTIGYAFYDVNEGCLNVIRNPEYHSEFKQAAVNLTDSTPCAETK